MECLWILQLHMKEPCVKTFYSISGAARISVRGGNILGGWPRRGSGGGAPRMPENFENFQKISQENCKKWIILGDLSKKLKNLR